MLSSSQDDPVAVPDSPQRGARALSDNRRAASSLVAVRPKSESPELSMSVRDYPSSQAGQTPSPSQISLIQVHQKPAENPISQGLTDTETSLQGRNSSPLTGSSSTHPFSHHGYHLLRSVTQQRPSQTDPIETDDNLSQEQIPRDRLTRRHLGHPLPVTSMILDRAQVRSPNDSTSDQRNVQSIRLEDSSDLRTEQSAGVRAQSSGPSAIVGTTSSKQLTKPPLAKTVLDPQGHVPTLAARREDSPDQSMQVPLLERNDPKNSQDLRLDIGSTAFIDIEAGKPSTTGHNPRETQPETITDPTAIEATSTLQTPSVRKSILAQTSHVDESPTPQLQIAKPTRDHTEVSRQTQLEPISRPSDKPTTIAGRDAQFDRELMASVKSCEKQDGSAKLGAPEQATQEDQQIRDTEVPPFDGGGKTVQGENTADCTSVSGDNISQKQARPAVMDTPKKRSSATQEAVSMDGSSCKAPQQSSVSKTALSGRKTGPEVRHRNVGEGINGSEIGRMIIKTDRSPEEKRAAEDRAKREADAVALFLAKEKKRSCTPSLKDTSKRKRCSSNQAPKSLKKAASVQGVQQKSSVSTQQPSSQEVGTKSLGKPRSMTPMFPTPSSSSLIRPTKSALRKSQSSTPRSVSFNDDPIAPPGPLKTTTSKWVEPKIESHQGASGTAKGSKATSKKIITEPKPSQTKVEQATSVKKDLKASGSKAGGSRTVGPKSGPQAIKQTGLPKPKTQTKLAVTRDVKLKGRADGPRKSPTPAMEKEDMSCDSEVSASTFYSDEENLPRSAKAGPSKKRKLTNAVKSSASSPDIGCEENHQPHAMVPKAEAHHSVPSTKGVNISRQTSTVRHPSISASKPKPQPQIKSSSPSISDQKSNVVAAAQVDSRQASRSRSPAQYISGASRSSSGSASDAGPRAESRTVDESVSESDSQYETGSDSEDTSSSASDSAEADSLIDSNGGTSLTNGVEREEDFKGSRSQSQTSNEPSNRKSVSASSRSASQSRTDEEDNEKIDRNLDQQLQRDARHSMKPSRQETIVQSAVKTERPAPVPIVKPGVSRFPSLTGLRGKASKTDDNADATATQSPKNPLPSRIPPKPVTQLQTQTIDDTSSSSSDSSDDTSSSDDQQSKLNGQLRGESAQPRPMKGIRALLKRMFSDDVPDIYSMSDNFISEQEAACSGGR